MYMFKYSDYMQHYSFCHFTDHLQCLSSSTALKLCSGKGKLNLMSSSAHVGHGTPEP